jgi:hypothetical protein
LLIGKHGDGLRLLPGSSRAAVAAWETGPDDLAAELNPHKTDLNPHQAVPAVSRAGADQKQCLSAHGAWLTGTQLARAGPAVTSPAIRGTP